MSELVGCHVCGELKENSDEDIKITIDVVVIGKHDAPAVIPTTTELGAGFHGRAAKMNLV